ncbi:MAG: hypothetical protein H0X29_09835 [Parachlamydiaceae bacterium]|nr:hypothetical protein [Parachlamydiaceae bacterium]
MRELKFLSKYTLIGAVLGIAGLTTIHAGKTIPLCKLVSQLGVIIIFIRPNSGSGIPLGALGGGLGATNGLGTTITVLGGMLPLFGALKKFSFADETVVNFTAMLIASITLTGALTGVVSKTLVKDEAMVEAAAAIAGSAAGALTIGIIKKIFAVPFSYYGLRPNIPEER